jgi:hypothetical protein
MPPVGAGGGIAVRPDGCCRERAREEGRGVSVLAGTAGWTKESRDPLLVLELAMRLKRGHDSGDAKPENRAGNNERVVVEGAKVFGFCRVRLGEVECDLVKPSATW